MRITTQFARGKDTSYKCIVTYPDDFNKAKEKLPMIVFLHGMGERGDDVELVAVHGIPKLFSANAEHRGLRVITVSPQCPANETWRTKVTGVMKFIENAADFYGADRDKISLTGLSMGGFGTFSVGEKYAKRFSCLAPICGGGHPEKAKDYGKIPIRIYHGTADTVVPPVCSQEMHDAITKAGGCSELTMYEGVGHDSWTAAYEKSDLIPWLVSKTRLK